MTQTHPAGPRPRRSLRTAAVRAAAVAVPLAALAVLGAACSSSSSSSTTTTTAASTAKSSSSTTATTSAPSTADDTALAHSQLLPASAYPAGWKGQGSGSTNTQASFFGGDSASEISSMASCLGISTDSINASPAEAADQEYDDPNANTTVTDTVEVFPTEAQAVADVEAAGNAKAPGCLAQLVGPDMGQKAAAQIGQGATVGTLTASAATLPSSYGDHDAAILISLPVTYQGVNMTMHIEDVAIQKGRSESILEVSDSDASSLSSTVNSLAPVVAAHTTD